jgi:ribosomal protein L21E
MTKEQLKVKVAKQLSIINEANVEISSYVNDYIESLPYKVGDKVICSRCDVCWIKSIVPEKSYSGYTGEIEVRINPAKKDGTRSNREFVLWSMEIDSIKKID